MGGAEVFTREVAKRWVAAGHEVTLFSSQFDGCKREEVVDGVRVVRGGGRYSVYGEAKKFYGKSCEGFDVVVDEINTKPFFAPRFVKNGERVVALIHQLAREYWFYETPFPVSYFGYHFLENRWLKGYTNLPTVTVSKSTEADLVGLGFKRVFVVPEGLNLRPLEALPQKSEVPVLVYCGRLKRAKRPDHAVRAFALLKERLPEAELWVIGDGPFKRELEGMAPLGVRFFSGLSNGERFELLRKAWVLVNPSVREGWGLNVIEANAFGVPCVGYDVCGLRDSIRDGETGFLAASGDVAGLAEKAYLLLSDVSLRERLGKNALTYAGTFDWDVCASRFMDILSLALEQSN